MLGKLSLRMLPFSPPLPTTSGLVPETLIRSRSSAPGALSPHRDSLEEAPEWTAVRVPGPPSRQPRHHRTVPQGKSRHATRASGGRPTVALPEWANHDQPRTQRRRFSAAPTHYRVVRTYPLRRRARADLTSLAVVPRRGRPRSLAGLRCIASQRPLRRLRTGNGGRNVTVVMARLRRLPVNQRRARTVMGRKAVGAGAAQPDERDRRARRGVP